MFFEQIYSRCALFGRTEDKYQNGDICSNKLKFKSIDDKVLDITHSHYLREKSRVSQGMDEFLTNRERERESGAGDLIRVF